MVDKQPDNNGKLGGATGKGFLPGKSGNPAGRPKNIKYIPDILREIGKEEGTKDGKYTKLDVVLRKVYQFALAGRPWAIEFIASRTEGKAVQQIDLNDMQQEEMEIDTSRWSKKEILTINSLIEKSRGIDTPDVGKSGSSNGTDKTPTGNNGTNGKANKT